MNNTTIENIDVAYEKFKPLIKIANKLFLNHRQHRAFHVCFILKNNRIVSLGWNLNKTHPVTHRFPYRSKYQKLHAEFVAINKLKNTDFSSLRLVVVRVNRLGILLNSKPCIGCKSIIEKLEFKEVWYSTNMGKFEQL